MYKRDLITAEIEQLTKVLARIMALKTEGKTNDAHQLFTQTLAQNFGLSTGLIFDEDSVAFNTWLAHSNPQKLDVLSQFLFNQWENAQNHQKNIAQKLNLIYQYLADTHHIVHLINLERQKIIQSSL